MRPLVVLVTFGLIFFDVPAVAHHSFAAEFDGKRCIVFEGVVTEVEWTNPHAFFFLNVKQSNGHVVNWAFETAGPNMLFHLGWKRDSIKVGDHIRVQAYPAWDGARIASARSVVLADGRKIQAGSASDGGPQP
jgi:hypothetical protein